RRRRRGNSRLAGILLRRGGRGRRRGLGRARDDGRLTLFFGDRLRRPEDADQRRHRHDSAAGDRHLLRRRELERLPHRDDCRRVGRRQRVTASQTVLAARLDAGAAFRANDVSHDYLTSRHERIRTPAWPTPLLKSSLLPKIDTFLPLPNTRCWSTMNGAVARSPAIVLISTLSCAVNVPSLLVSYAAPPMKVNAYRFADGGLHGVSELKVVVVKNTMSPATAGNAVTRSSALSVFVLVSRRSNDLEPVAAPLSRTAS